MAENEYQVTMTLEAEIEKKYIEKFFDWLVLRAETHEADCGGGWHVEENVGYVFDFVLSGLSERDVAEFKNEIEAVLDIYEWETEIIVTPIQEDGGAEDGQEKET
jgi:hypothetical protein